ncbi:hypothetical protein BRDID11002_22640 [Bradyrhizobium diazoefficiens]
MGALSAAVAEEAEERGKAASTMFQALWKAAEPLFAEGGTGACWYAQICETPVTDSAAGSAGAIREHIAKHLEELARLCRRQEGARRSQDRGDQSSYPIGGGVTGAYWPLSATMKRN